MSVNAYGLDVKGSKNPNWRGGKISKKCAVCGSDYQVKRVHSTSKYCSMRCVGISQRGISSPRKASRRTMKDCEICGMAFSVYVSHMNRSKCCSRECSLQRRAVLMKGEGNPNWSGGVSRLPYPWNFREISRQVVQRDGFKCQNPTCAGTDSRLTTHHINYIKTDCRQENLICLCSACNSKANFGREYWSALYELIIAAKKDGGGWAVEEF
jgi:hypothetical protein